jgi:hypothetical protein
MWVKLVTRLRTIATSNYVPNKEYSKNQQLQLFVGDLITVIEEHPSGWYHGVKINAKGVYENGIFPSSCVHIIQQNESCSSVAEDKILVNDLVKAKASLMPTSFDSDLFLTLGSEDQCASDEDILTKILQEANLVLKEWGVRLKHALMARKYAVFNDVYDCFKNINRSKRHLIAEQLSKNQIAKIAKEIYAEIDRGNGLLGIGIIARREDSFVEPEWNNASALSVNEMYEDQESKNSKKSKRNSALLNRVKATPGTQTHLDTPNFHLFFDLKAFIASIGSSKEHNCLYFSLYDSRTDEFLSEDYEVVLTYNGMPVDEDKIGKLRTLFADLTEKEILNGSIYLVCRIYRIGRMNISEKSNNDFHYSFKRPFGVSVFPITSCLSQEITENYMKIYTPNNEAMFSHLHHLIIEKSNGFETNQKAEGLYISLKLYQGDRTKLISQHALLKEACLSRRFGHPETLLYHDCFIDLANNRNVQAEEYKNRCYTRLFVLLKQGDFQQGFKTASKNIQIDVCVRNNLTGEFVQNVFPAGNKYSSCIYYHTNSPKWNEKLVIDLPRGLQVDQCHLFLTFKHCSSETKNSSKEQGNTFAFTFLPLMNPAESILLPSDSYKLSLFKYDVNLAHPNVYIRQQWLPLYVELDEKAGQNGSGECPGNAFVRNFNAIPASVLHSADVRSYRKNSLNVAVNGESTPQEEAEAENVNPNSSFRLITSLDSTNSSKTSDKLRMTNMQKLTFSRDHFLMHVLTSSNEFTNNIYLSNFLEWERRKFTMRLTTILEEYIFNVPVKDMLLFFPQILDVLFAMMKFAFKKKDNYENFSKIQTLIFSAFIHTVYTINHAKYFKAIEPLLEYYIQDVFDAPLNGVHLLQALIHSVMYKASSKDLRNALKVIGIIFKFVNRAYVLYEDKTEFKVYLNQYFEALETLLASNESSKSDASLAAPDVTKLLAIQHFADMIINLQDKMYCTIELSNIVLRFCTKVPITSSKFVTHLLKLFYQLTKSTVFKSSQMCRDELMRFICEKMTFLIALFLLLDEKSKSAQNRFPFADAVHGSALYKRFSKSFNPHDIETSLLDINNIEQLMETYSPGQLEATVSLCVDILAHVIQEYLAMMHDNSGSCNSIRHLALIVPELLHYYCYLNGISEVDESTADFKTLSSLILTIFQLLPFNYNTTFLPETIGNRLSWYLINLFIFLEDVFSFKHLSESEYTMKKFSTKIAFKILKQVQLLLCEKFLVKGPMATETSTSFSNAKQVTLSQDRPLWTGLFLLVVEQTKALLKHEKETIFFKQIYEMDAMDLTHSINLLTTVWNSLRDQHETAFYKELINPLLELIVLDQSDTSNNETYPINHVTNKHSWPLMHIYFEMLVKECMLTNQVLNTKHETINYIKSIEVKEKFRVFFHSYLTHLIEAEEFQQSKRDSYEYLFVQRIIDDVISNVANENQVYSPKKYLKADFIFGTLKHFLEEVERFFELIIDLQSISSVFVDERCFIEFKLIEFYKSVQMETLYLTSLHQPFV